MPSRVIESRDPSAQHRWKISSWQRRRNSLLFFLSFFLCVCPIGIFGWTFPYGDDAVSERSVWPLCHVTSTLCAHRSWVASIRRDLLVVPLDFWLNRAVRLGNLFFFFFFLGETQRDYLSLSTWLVDQYLLSHCLSSRNWWKMNKIQSSSFYPHRMGSSTCYGSEILLVFPSGVNWIPVIWHTSWSTSSRARPLLSHFFIPPLPLSPLSSRYGKRGSHVRWTGDYLNWRETTNWRETNNNKSI